MKKWTALLLSVILAASVGMVGCGKDDGLVNSSEEIASGVEESSEESTEEGSEEFEKESSETSSEEVSSEESSSAVSKEESSSKPTSSKEQSSKPTSSKEQSSKPVSSKDESSKPVSSSSSAAEESSETTSAPESSDIGCMTLLETAVSGTELPGMMFYEPSMDDAMEAELAEYFYTGFNLADVSDYCVGVPMMMVHASEIAIFKPVDAAAAKAIHAVIDARVEALNNVWSTYLPDQFALVEDHRVVEADGYILFVVAADADKIVKQFEAAVK